MMDMDTNDPNESKVAKNVRQSFATRFAKKSKVPLSKRFTKSNYLAPDSKSKSGQHHGDSRSSQAHLLRKSDVDLDSDDDI